jgi:AmmeMemoRadiSam system protein A
MTSLHNVQSAEADTIVGRSSFIAFWGDLSMETNDSNARFTEKEGQLLVKLARDTIEKELTGESPDTESDTLGPVLQDASFQVHGGTFVTLKIQGKLRGCIGNLTSEVSVLEGVKRNAINAAFHDPRFSPLSAAELEKTEIEVSILTTPLPLVYQQPQDLTQKLRVHVDGVIIRKGHLSATFLPQVWEQLPRPEDFLTHLCLKAGLPADAWKSAELEVSTYQVQYFEER